MESLFNDLRHGARVLLANPGFTAIAILAIALGIGANSAIFTVVNAILLRPLPYTHPERIASIWSVNPTVHIGIDKIPNSAAQFVDYRDQSDAFEHIAAFKSDSLNLEGRGQPEKLGTTQVTADFFAVLGAKPALGRTFLPEEDQPGHNREVVLSHSLWERRFGGDRGIVGESLTLSGKGYTVVGVMPAGFNYPRGADMPALLQFAPQTDLWTPMAFSADRLNRRRSFNNSLIARLKPGTTIGQAQTELSTIAALNEQRYPQTDADFGALVLPMHDQTVGGLRPALMILLGAVGFVLLIACANVANLMLARAAGRQKEIAIRTALGAGRLRIIRQLLTESLLLSHAGAALGLLLAYCGVKLLVAAAPDNIPRIKDVSLDMRVLLFTLGMTILSGIVFGLAPALQSSKPDLNESLKEGSRGSTSRRHRIRDGLVVAEVALSLVLLIGAGLMIRSIVRLYQVDLGLDPNNVLTMQLNLPFSRYSKPEQRVTFYRQVIARIRALPGVTSVAGVSHIPLTGGGDIEGLSIEGQPPPASLDKASLANYDGVMADYFGTMKIPLLSGRVFEERDDGKAPGVVVVNEAFARRYLAGSDPVGTRIMNGLPGEPGISWLSIIGVVGNVKYDALDSEIKPAVYYHYPQDIYHQDLEIVVRTRGESSSFAAGAENEIWAVDEDMPIYNVATMDQIISESASQRRFNLLLMSLFAIIALVLAAIGIYGVMSYSVTQRTHEIGIRMALGAKGSDVVRMVVVRGMALAAVGAAAGVGTAIGLTRLMESLLFSTSTMDPLTFAVIPLLMMVVALVSNLLPARRATRVDPLVALRYE